MKRKRILLSDIACYENLSLAVWKAARGKRHRPDVVDFTKQLDTSLSVLAEDILQERVPYGHYQAFKIHDPKERLIHAACFEDRVLHHAIMNQAESVFERTLVPTTYACRPDKGVHLAIQQVQDNLRRYPWFVKIDISGYFPAIDHKVLFQLLQQRFKGDDFLYLLWRIIDSWHSDHRDKGLPIGSLTSQHFANYYLDGADRFLLELLKVNGHVRYMDDLLFWCNNKNEAKIKLEQLAEWLADERQLEIKAGAQIGCSKQGVSYCGYRVLKGRILLNKRKRQRYQQLRLYWEQAWLDGEITETELQQAYQSVHAITLHADSLKWRKENLRRYSPPAIYRGG